jgi:hypothetical protein
MRSNAEQAKLRKVWEKTNGHCHFCGDAVEFEKYGKNGGDEAWVLDHIAQKARGGSKDIDNCLPACHRCNHLRWHRSGEAIRRLLWLGLVAKDEIEKGSSIGKKLEELSTKRLADNEKRRASKKGLASANEDAESTEISL